jgi:hypothetical protein
MYVYPTGGLPCRDNQHLRFFSRHPSIMTRGKAKSCVVVTEPRTSLVACQRVRKSDTLPIARSRPSLNDTTNQ